MHGQPVLGIILSNKYEGHGVYASGVTQEARLYSHPAQRAWPRGTALTGFGRVGGSLTAEAGRWPGETSLSNWNMLESETAWTSHKVLALFSQTSSVVPRQPLVCLSTCARECCVCSHTLETMLIENTRQSWAGFCFSRCHICSYVPSLRLVSSLSCLRTWLDRICMWPEAHEIPSIRVTHPQWLLSHTSEKLPGS